MNRNKSMNGNNNGIEEKDIIFLISNFSKLLNQENSYLKKYNMQKVMELQPQKEEMIDLLELIVNKMNNKEVDFFNDISLSRKEEIKIAVNIFGKVINDNFERLVSMKKLNNKIINSTISNNESNQYNAKGEIESYYDNKFTTEV